MKKFSSFFHTLYAHEIKLISLLQSIRSDRIDHFFFFFNIFDYGFTYIFITFLVWQSISLSAAVHLSYLLAVTALTGSILKFLLAQPRPYTLLPTLKIVGTNGYGFPSEEAAIIVVTFGFIFFLQAPINILVQIGALLIIFLVGLTRVYLGAHFPSDVLGGYVLGILILTLYAHSINFRLIPMKIVELLN